MYEYFCVIPLFRNGTLFINVGELITNLMFTSGTYYATVKSNGEEIELTPNEFDAFFVKKSESQSTCEEQNKWLEKISPLAR